MTNTPDSSPDAPTALKPSFFWLSILGWIKGCKWRQAAIIFITALTLFRFWYSGTLDLVADEAYYWLWSNNLDLCYYSKGPGIAWTIAAGTWLWGDTVFGIRFFAVLLSAATGYWIFRLGRSLFDPRTGFLALVLTACLPLYAVGSILMTIDPLSLFFWTLAAYAFWQAKDKDCPVHWILPGLWIGLGMLCKYTNIAEIISFALFCLWSPSYRRHLKQTTFWTMVIVSFLSLLPTIIWNARHDWITLQHLLERGKLSSGDTFTFKFGELTQFFSEQALVYSPFLWLAILISAFVIAKTLFSSGGASLDIRDDGNANKTPRSHSWKFLLTLFLPLPIFYSLLSINEAGEANWTAPAYLSGIIILSAFILHQTRAGGWKRKALWTAVVIGALQTVALHNTSWIPFHKVGIQDPLDRVRSHQQLAQTVSTLQQERGASFIVARHYQTASLISFYHPDQPHVYMPESDRIENQFSFWPGYSEMMTNELSALFVCRNEEKPRESIYQEFSKVTLIKEFDTTFQGRPLQRYRIYFLENYHGGHELLQLSEPEPPTELPID
jgi:4-amino-4-deoxy-L-arabinose transferase-like glycosyltransferase